MGLGERAADSAGQAARDASRSDAVERLARLGLASRGVVWLVVGLLVVSVLSGGQERTDQGGAVAAIAAQPFGEVLLVVLVVGFAGYVAWQGLSAVAGHRGEDGAKRTGKRLVSAGQALLYAALALTTVRFLLTHRSGSDPTRSTTGEVLSRPGGQFVVGAAGLAVVVVGVVLVVRALQRKHVRDLEHYRLPDRLRGPAVHVGTAGLTGRGLVAVLLGAFLLQAAVEADPDEARGLDAALQELAGQPYGTVLLALAALGLLAYGLWSFVEAAYRRI